MPQLKRNLSLIIINRAGTNGTDLQVFERGEPYSDCQCVWANELAAKVVACNDSFNRFSGEKAGVTFFLDSTKHLLGRWSNKSDSCGASKVCGANIKNHIVENLSVRSYSMAHGTDHFVGEKAKVESQAISEYCIGSAKIKKVESVQIKDASSNDLGVIDLVQVSCGRAITVDVNEYQLSDRKINANIDYIITTRCPKIKEKPRGIIYINFVLVEHEQFWMDSIIGDVLAKTKPLKTISSYHG